MNRQLVFKIILMSVFVVFSLKPVQAKEETLIPASLEALKTAIAEMTWA